MSIKERLARAIEQWVNGAPPNHWTLEEALEFIRVIEPIFADVGWHVGLTGSVLYKGVSDHDLDVIVFPHSTAIASKDALLEALKRAEMRPQFSREAVLNHWRTKGSNDDKWVEVWIVKAERWRGRRVDLFFLQ